MTSEAINAWVASIDAWASARVAGGLNLATLDKLVDGNEAKDVTEIRTLANHCQPAAAGSAWLWWREMTLAARWRGW